MPSNSQKEILLIIPYFGVWPVWFDAFLVSVEYNPSVHFLCPTDCKIPEKHPQNIKFVPTNLREMNELVDGVLGFHVPLSIRKLCDVKVAYGHIFSGQIQGYTFWGFCDMDIIWGDIKSYLTEHILENYDIITARKEAIAGHFTIFRNTPEINTLFQRIPRVQEYLNDEKHFRIDEVALTDFLGNAALKPKDIRVYWKTYLLYTKKGRAHQEYTLNRWYFDAGKLLDLGSKEKSEYMYLHFINWKKTMRYCDIVYGDGKSTFYISFNGIHTTKIPRWTRVFHNFKNEFFGYRMQEQFRLHKKRWQKVLQRYF